MWTAESAAELVRRAAAYPCDGGWRQLDVETLRGVAAREGVDFATALLYARLRDSPDQGPAIADLDRIMATGPGSPADCVRGVAVVAGGCHEESADSRECLSRVLEQLQGAGLETRLIPTLSFGPLPENAASVARNLRQLEGDCWGLVSLSKGSAELKLALHREPGLLEKVRIWVNLSGLLYGSQWVRWLLDRPVSRLGARAWSWYWRYPFSALEQLRRAPGSLLDFDSPLPPQVRVVHVAGFPLRGDFTHRYARRSHERLAGWGPSDGMGFLLGDLTRTSGVVYPVWRADHFLRSGAVQIQDFALRALRWSAAVPAQRGSA